MSDGHVIGIVLLDGSEICIPVQHKLLTRELRDIVASHVNIRERDHFGLAFVEDGLWNYLQLDRFVLDHDLPKTTGQLKLYFLVQFYIERVRLLSDSNSYEQFYLHAKHALFKGELECDPDIFFRLTSLVIQITESDYKDNETAKQHLKKLNAFPLWIFQLHPSLEYCTTQVIQYYQSHHGLEKGEAIMEFLDLVERVPSYGIHFYEVKDKSEQPWWLGLGYKGISQFDYRDKNIPRKSYLWNQINEVSFSKQKITLEVFDGKRGSLPYYSTLAMLTENSNGIGGSMTRRGFATSSIPWYAATAKRAKIFATMANDHLNFVIKGKSNKPQHSSSMRSKSDVAFELTHRRHSFSKLPAMQLAKNKTMERKMVAHVVDCDDDVTSGSNQSISEIRRPSQTVLLDQMSVASSASTSGSGKTSSRSCPRGFLVGTEELPGSGGASCGSSLSTDSPPMSMGDPRCGFPVDLSVEEAKLRLEKLKSARFELSERLELKKTEMRQLIVREFEITGVMPESYSNFGCDISMGRQYHKTEFVFSPDVVKKIASSHISHTSLTPSQRTIEDKIRDLENERAVVNNIYEATKSKAKNSKNKGSLKVDCKEYATKLKKLDKELEHLHQLQSSTTSYSSAKGLTTTFIPSSATLPASTRRLHDIEVDSVSLVDTHGSSMVSLYPPSCSSGTSRVSNSSSSAMSATSSSTGEPPHKFRWKKGPRIRRFLSFKSSQSSLPELCQSSPHCSSQISLPFSRSLNGTDSVSSVPPQSSPAQVSLPPNSPPSNHHQLSSRDNTLGRKTASCPVAPSTHTHMNGGAVTVTNAKGDSGFISMHLDQPNSGFSSTDESSTLTRPAGDDNNPVTVTTIPTSDVTTTDEDEDSDVTTPCPNSATIPAEANEIPTMAVIPRIRAAPNDNSFYSKRLSSSESKINLVGNHNTGGSSPFWYQPHDLEPAVSHADSLSKISSELTPSCWTDGVESKTESVILDNDIEDRRQYSGKLRSASLMRSSRLRDADPLQMSQEERLVALKMKLRDDQLKMSQEERLVVLKMKLNQAL